VEDLTLRVKITSRGGLDVEDLVGERQVNRGKVRMRRRLNIRGEPHEILEIQCSWLQFC
jgi:hypothetical protein